MEKITILVGMADRAIATTFMDGVEEALKARKIEIAIINSKYLVLETRYTRTAFIYDISKQPLNGIEADALFGIEPYRQKLAPYLKKKCVYNNDIGLVDYIAKQETRGKIKEASEQCINAFKNHITWKIDKTLHEATSDTIKDVHVEPLYPKQIYISSAQTTGKTMFMKEMEKYLKEDCDITYNLWRKTMNTNTPTLPEIKNVIFNNPATIVFWADGTKTIVRCQDGDIYDPEKGLAMAISKKILGNKHDYYHTFKHWLKKCKEV